MTESLHGFELIKTQDVPELKTKAKLFRHVKTGAELLSMENDDENKVFGVTFATPPTDSTGVAHIMEHSVLGGSRKYHLKEPFVQLIKGSLQTFVNAMTFPDKTTYPVASQNIKDFYNLIDVYLDAVFYPLITPQTLQQEGWHYELDAPEGEMIFKGIVFNEMKGNYSNPDNLIGEFTRQSLYPDNAYSVDSGGDPKVIPNLTYAQFKGFHDTYYHPSNALIYFYGDDDPTERLCLLDAYLKDFDPIKVDSTIKLQPKFAAPKRLTYGYDAGKDELAKKGMTTVNWVLLGDGDAEGLLALTILDYILIGTPAAPLRKALIESGLGEDLAGGGLEADMRQPYYSIGLKNIAVENAEKVEALVLDTLNKLAKEGIAPDTISAAINTIEFRLRENNTGNYPRGLIVMLRALGTWLYDGDPLANVAFEAPLTAIKAHLKSDPHYFEGLIQHYLLDNQHRTTVTLKPDPELREQEDAAEKARLAAARAAMTDADIQAVIESTQQLKLLQETPDSPEALATIPTLSLPDLDKKNKITPLAVLREAETPILYHDIFTNGITYLDLGFNLHALPQELLPYVRLFGRALLEMGTTHEDYIKLSQRIGQQTGGLRTMPFASALKGDTAGAAWLFLRGKSTTDHDDDLLAILHDILLDVKLDNQERFRQIVLEEKASREAAIVPSGHIFAMTRLNAHFTTADWAAAQISGIDYLFFLRDLAQLIDRDWAAVVEKLESIRRLLANRQALVVNVTTDAARWEQFLPKVAKFLGGLPLADIHFVEWTPSQRPANEGLTIPAQVNYVAKGANLYEQGYKLHGSIMVIDGYLRTTWLWDRVRVQGGAYGGFCRFDPYSGVLDYVSYRDPNLLGTLETYDKTGQFLRDLALDERELTRGIIGAISDLDTYRLPDAKGYLSMLNHLLGETDEHQQQLRDEVLGTTVADFKAFANVVDQINDKGLVAVIGSQPAIEAANAERGNFLDVCRVL